MKWLELHIDTQPCGIEPVSELLGGCGIDGLVIDDRNHPKNYGGPYIFANFNWNNKSADYVEDFPYHLTEEVVLKNVTTTSGKPVRLSPNTYMFRNVKVVK